MTLDDAETALILASLQASVWGLFADRPTLIAPAESADLPDDSL